MTPQEFQKALEKAKFTRYGFAQITGMRWETIDGYWRGKTRIPKKVEALIDMYVKNARKEKTKGKAKKGGEIKQEAARKQAAG